MYAIRQLLRQPLKTVSGMIVIALTVAILCVCVGQSIAAETTEAEIDYRFTTVALISPEFQEETDQFGASHYMPFISDEIQAWIDQAIEEYPELVEAVASPGLASAYISGLVPDNYTSHLNQTAQKSRYTSINLTAMPDGMPYSCAMLEVTLDMIGEPMEWKSNSGASSDTDDYVIASLQYPLTATVESVLGLQEGFRDPTGTTLYLTLVLPDQQSMENLGLTVGERYLVYGMDYQDLDWQLRSEIAQESDYEIEIDAFDPEKLQYTDEKTIQKAEESGRSSYTVAMYHYGEHWVVIDNNDAKKLLSSSLTVQDRSVTPVPWTTTIDEDGNAQIQISDTRAYIDENGQRVTVSQTEYQDRYSVPTIVHLEGSVQDFLTSEEGTAWAATLEQMEINNHAFPIIGVDKMGYIAEFARENARIVNGRDFTQEELDTGEKVCIISETLATENGLAVGDSISLRYYRGDMSLPYQSNLEVGYGTTNPTANFYFGTTPFENDNEEYTIIGLYRQDNAWGDVSKNVYSFTPNTIFTPKASVTGTMTYSDQGFFRTIVIKNDALEEFRTLVDSSGYEGLFVYYDQGYTTAVENMHNYQAISRRALVVGIVISAVTMLLFVLIFPFQERRTIMMMGSVGANRGRRVWYIMKKSLGVLLPGTVAGVILGMLIKEKALGAMMASAGAELSITVEPKVFCLVAGAQLCVITGIVLVAVLIMTRRKSLMVSK